MNKEDVMLILEAPEFALRELEKVSEKYERAYTRVTGGAIRYDKERVDGGGGDPEMPLVMVAQYSVERDEAQLAYRLAVETAERCIGSLSDEREQAVLMSRYVTAPALTWTQIAQALGLSLRQTYRLKNSAIASLCGAGCGEVLAAVS